MVYMRIAKALIRLRACAVLSGPSLSTNGRYLDSSSVEHRTDIPNGLCSSLDTAVIFSHPVTFGGQYRGST